MKACVCTSNRRWPQRRPAHKRCPSKAARSNSGLRSCRPKPWRCGSHAPHPTGSPKTIANPGAGERLAWGQSSRPMRQVVTASDAAEPETDSVAPPPRPPSRLSEIVAVPWVGVLGVIVLLAIFMTFKTGAIFLSPDNLSSVALDFSYIAMAALGSAIVIIGGGIDLSVGANMALTGLLTALAIAAGWPIPLAIAAGLGVGILAGVLNAALITGIGLIPFIATLGTMSIFRGLGTGIVQGQTVNAANGFTVIGQGY